MQIYKTINKINQKWYIGKDSTDRSYYFGSGKILKHAINKYGKDNFEKVILEQLSNTSTLSDLCEREKHWIKITDAVNDKMSYNLGGGGEGGDLSKYVDYKKKEYKGDYFAAAKKWYQALTRDEQKAWHKKQNQKHSKVWYVSKKEIPDIEIKVVNLSEWEEQNIPGFSIRCTSTIGGPNYGKSIKGWRCRRKEDLNYPPYINLRKIGHPNIACKGRRWKVIDGKRVWFNNE